MRKTDSHPNATAFRTLCRRQGWRSTAQRRAVFACLRGNREHPSVENVWSRVREDLPDVSLDSVYRILDEFAEAGVVRRLVHGRFLRYDGNPAPHHHFQCADCGRVFDFECSGLEPILAACGEFAAPDGEVALCLYGRCRACAPAKE